MTQAVLAHLAEPFHRAPITANLAAGLGLGLYIAKALVAALGGRLWATRRDDYPGSIVAFTLPNGAAGTGRGA
jgi:signal transduction histidine kinase